jgi:hypothetical protein
MTGQYRVHALGIGPWGKITYPPHLLVPRLHYYPLHFTYLIYNLLHIFCTPPAQ